MALRRARFDRFLCVAMMTCASCVLGCRDVSRFSTGSGRFEGTVVKGSFVRSGVTEDVRMCLTLDATRLQDAPGTITTSDGRFRRARLRPIPQLFHDPLSTLDFGEGRARNIVYAATPASSGIAADDVDVLVVVSLMNEGGIEVRLLRGAPSESPAGAPAIFGVFPLERRDGQCSF